MYINKNLSLSQARFFKVKSLICVIIVLYVGIAALNFLVYALEYTYRFLYLLAICTEYGVQGIQTWKNDTDGHDLTTSVILSVFWPFTIWNLPKYLGETKKRSSLKTILTNKDRIKENWDIYKNKRGYVIYKYSGNKRKGKRLYWDNKEGGFNSNLKQAKVYETFQEAKFMAEEKGLRVIRIR